MDLSSDRANRRDAHDVQLGNRSPVRRNRDRLGRASDANGVRTKSPMKLLFITFCTASLCVAQDPSALLQDSTVKAALEAVQRNEPKFIDEQIRICEIPAPPFKETERAQELKRLFTNLGLKNVRIDKVGNVIGVRPGQSPRPNLVFSAHLDTVFPEGTNVKVARDGSVLKG